MTQEQLSASKSQPPSDSIIATMHIEAYVHAQMSLLAKQFLVLLDAISRAGLMRQMRGKSSQGVVMGAANVYSGPSTRETLVDVARPGMMVRVYAQETGQAFPPGNVWYRSQSLPRHHATSLQGWSSGAICTNRSSSISNWLPECGKQPRPIASRNWLTMPPIRQQ